MINKEFELDRLRHTLRTRGLNESSIDLIVAKASQEIEAAMAEKMAAAMESAVELGVEKDSADFINDIKPRPGAFQLETSSGNTDFSTPPFPMLPRLLSGAKPIKDGSGVYKIIPVGKPGNKPRISANIFDAQKSIVAERAELAKRQYNKVSPGGSKGEFRTATSKQSQLTQWVMPAKEKDFTEDVISINETLAKELEDVVMGVIREYEDIV